MNSEEITNTKQADGACQITKFLVTVGQNALKKYGHSEWMDVEAMVELCEEQQIEFEGHIPTAKELEPALKDFFKGTEELYAEGVNVVSADRRMGWELVFMLRFYPYNPEYRKNRLAEPFHYEATELEQTEETQEAA